MKRLTSGVGPALLVLGLVSGSGCSNENEAAFNAQFAKSDASQIKEPVAPVNSQADWGKQSGGGTAAGYPGQAGAPKPKAKGAPRRHARSSSVRCRDDARAPRPFHSRPPDAAPSTC